MACNLAGSIQSIRKLHAVVICRLDRPTVNSHGNGALNSLQSNGKMVMELICVCGKGVDVIGDRASQPIFDFLTDLGVAHVSPGAVLFNLLVDGRNAGLLLNFDRFIANNSENGGSGSFSVCDGRGVSHKEPVAV